MTSEPRPSESHLPSSYHDLPPVLPPVSPLSVACEAHIGLDLVEEAQPYPRGQYAQQAAPEAEPLSPPATQNHLPRAHAAHPPNHPHPEWLSLIMSFCFAGISMALQSIQASNHVPLSFHMAGLGVVFALAAFVVSKYIPTYLTREALFLENAGVFFGVTAFFLDITLSFPLCLKIISWVIYVAALLAVILFRCFSVWFFNTDRIESRVET